MGCGHREGDELAPGIRLFLSFVEEYGRQLVVLLGRDRVDLVVVATGTPDRHGKERLTGRRHHVVEAVKLAFVGIFGRAQVGSHLNEHAQVAKCGGETLRSPGNLAADELVVRQVVIESANHGVAVSIRVLSNCVVPLMGSLALAKTSHIQPVPSPPFPVVRVGEQPVNEFAKGIRGRISNERLDFVGRRRQTDQVEVGAANQGAPIGLPCGAKLHLVQLGEDETIDGRVHPGGLFRTCRRDLRWIDSTQGVEGPVSAS